tara:strand:- start:274 stop:702 length:429 start_codon:yes stop_codon:yes gene_type:complete
MKVDNSPPVDREIAALDSMDRSALMQRWRTAYGQDAPARLSRILMKKAIAYEIQVRAFGGPSARTIRSLKAAAKSGAAVAPRRQPGRGTRLVREWNGILHEVDVLDEGFMWRGQLYRSLSAVAFAITGTKWSGPKFFGIGRN